MKFKKFKKLMKRWDKHQHKSQDTELIPEYHYLENSFVNVDPNTHVADVGANYDSCSTSTTFPGIKYPIEEVDYATGTGEPTRHGFINKVGTGTLYDWLSINYPITGEVFTDFQTECFELFISKHKAYGSNNLIHETTELTAEGIMLRVKDKLNRINNLIHNGADGESESVKDSLMDICNYTTILHIILQGKWGK